MSIYIYTNGSIYSPADPYATALLTENGTVTWIGSDAGARSITDERMRAIDLNGKLITPTFARAFAPINNYSEKRSTSTSSEHIPRDTIPTHSQEQYETSRPYAHHSTRFIQHTQQPQTYDSS